MILNGQSRNNKKTFNDKRDSKSNSLDSKQISTSIPSIKEGSGHQQIGRINISPLRAALNNQSSKKDVFEDK